MPKRETGELILRGKTWYLRYYDNRGRRRQESSGSEKRAEAERTLRQRLKAKDDGLPVGPEVGKVRFTDAAKDLVTDYQITGKRSIKVAQRRIDKHLTPYFGTMRMVAITTTEIRAFIAKRQKDTVLVRKARRWQSPNGRWQHDHEVRRPVSNAEINRELTTLKRMFSLAIQAGKLHYKPHIPLLAENNTRTGFFELDQFRSVLAHLPEEIQPIVTFAYVTGWRIASEVLPLEWRHVDFTGGEVRLDPGTTKNGDGRVFIMTDDLRALLEAQHVEHERLKKAGHICPFVFFRLVADERGGEKKPRRVKAFTKAWKNACRAAGCPGRIPHDFRRTAVRNMVRRGVPERVAMQLTGHKTRSVFERYNIVSNGDLHTAASRLSGLMNGTNGTNNGTNAPLTAGAPHGTARFAK
jgi:integrase